MLVLGYQELLRRAMNLAQMLKPQECPKPLVGYVSRSNEVDDAPASFVATPLPSSQLKVIHVTAERDPDGSNAVHVLVVLDLIGVGWMRLFSIHQQKVQELGSFKEPGLKCVCLSPWAYGCAYVCSVSHPEGFYLYDIVKSQMVQQFRINGDRMVPLTSKELLVAQLQGWSTGLHIVRDEKVECLATVRSGPILEVDPLEQYCLAGGYAVNAAEEGGVECEIVAFRIESAGLKRTGELSTRLTEELKDDDCGLVKFFPPDHSAADVVHGAVATTGGVTIFQIVGGGFRIARRIRLKGVDFTKPFAFFLSNAYGVTRPAWLLSTNGRGVQVRNLTGDDPNEVNRLEYCMDSITMLLVDSKSSAIVVRFGDRYVAVWK